MFIPVIKPANHIPKDKHDNLIANALRRSRSTFGEEHTMMQYLLQNFKFRKARPYQNLIKSVASEKLDHIELIPAPFVTLLDDGSSPVSCPKIS
jgi:Mn-containing catalase